MSSTMLPTDIVFSNDRDALFLCLPLVILGIYFSYKFCLARRERLNFIQTHKCSATGPSYPGISFLFGYDFLLENVFNVIKYRFTQGVAERFERYGPTFKSQILLKGIINTIDPENLEAVFKTHFEDYKLISAREYMMKTFYGDGIIGNSGHEWKKSRAIVHPAIANLSPDQAIFDRHASHLVEAIRSLPAGPFDFSKYASEYMLDVASEIFFGESTNVLQGQQGDARLRQFATDFTMLGRMARVMTIFNRQFPFLRYLMFRNDYRPTTQRVNEFVDIEVQKAFASKQTPPPSPAEKQEDFKTTRTPKTLVEGLASQCPDKQRVRQETLNCLLPARDSNAIVLGETLYKLARHPKIWAKLRQEVSDTLHGSAAPTIADLNKMTYLKYILNEVLRLNPTISTHGRLATRHTFLPRGGGPTGLSPLFVPRGTYVVYSIHALQRNPAVFGPDAESFRPERWENVSPKQFEYFPFGAGPRVCLGKTLGWTMVAYAVVKMAQGFREVLPRDESPYEEARAFGFMNRCGAWVECLGDEEEKGRGGDEGDGW